MINKVFWVIIMLLSAIVLVVAPFYGYTARLGIGWGLFAFLWGFAIGAKSMKNVKFGTIYAKKEDAEISEDTIVEA